MIHRIESGVSGKGVLCDIWIAVLVIWFLIAEAQGGPASVFLSEKNYQPHTYPQRVRVSEQIFPWRAIGRINLAGRGYCTATLVARDVVLTAAHCMWNRETGRWYPLQYLTFVAGVHGDAVQGSSRIKRMLVSRKVKAAVNPVNKPWRDVRSDWALLRLAEPLGDSLGFLTLSDGRQVSVGMPVVHAGYREDYQRVLTVQRGCFITGVHDQRRLLRSNCQSKRGDSGGPLLLNKGGRWYLLGLHSVRAGRFQSLAVASRVYSGLWSD